MVNPSRVVSFPSPRFFNGFTNPSFNRGEEENETTRDGFTMMSTPHDIGPVVCLGSVASIETTLHTLRAKGLKNKSCESYVGVKTPYFVFRAFNLFHSVFSHLLFLVMKVILFFLYASLYLHHNEGKVTLPQNVSVPAVIAFGDSLMDQGNNNDIKTVLKANFPPYGMDFISGNPTGRFSNGKTLADFFAKGFGVKEYLPAYLDPLIQDKDLLTGVSFASGGAGYDPLTAKLSNVMPLSVQLEMFKQYIITLKENIGEEATMNIIAKSVFLVSAGSNDFLVNYFTFPIRRVEYDVPAYCNKLVKLAMRFIKEIHKLGARRIAVFSTSAIGCIPVERTLHGGARRMCIDKYNKAAKLFNNMLKLQLDVLARSLPHSRIAFSDFYNPLMNIIENPQQYGIDLEVTNRGCCGTGELEMCFLCNKRTSRTCHNDSNFFFWDSLHPTEKGCDIFVNIVLPDLMKSLV
ncbi:hypothetical protein LXL04_015132 [Taraxacum kok-saghyz]